MASLNNLTIEIPEAKIFRYALNEQHPSGKYKAFVFESVLGFNSSNGDKLIEKIKAAVLQNVDRLTEKGRTPDGSLRYELILEIEGENGRVAKVLTAWQKIGSTLRLVTIHVCKNR